MHNYIFCLTMDMCNKKKNTLGYSIYIHTLQVFSLSCEEKSLIYATFRYYSERKNRKASTF